MVEETENKEITNEEVTPQVEEAAAAPVEEAPASDASPEVETTTESDPAHLNLLL